MKKEKKILKTQIIAKVAQKTNITETHAEKIINTFLDILQYDMKNCDKAVLRGFGTFFATDKESHIAKNPRTGVKIKIPKRRYVKFKAGDVFKDIINNRLEEDEKK